VADGASIDLTNQLMFEAWVRPTALSAWTTILLKERGTGLSYLTTLAGRSILQFAVGRRRQAAELIERHLALVLCQERQKRLVVA
jgi:hypothetical protein